MKRSIFIFSLLIVALAGWGRTVVRETVVERPVVTRETMVETAPPVTREVIVAGPAACSLAGTGYSHGSISCQAGYQYRCRDGSWERVPNSIC